MARKFGERWIATGETLGEGGQGQALWVTDGPGGERFVLKRLKNPARIGRLETEVAALRALDSDRIPKLVDFSLTAPAFVVTTFAGEPLPSLIEQGLDADSVLSLFRDVVEGIRDAHAEGLVHRDIKPDNVVVANSRASVIDFGICQFVSGEYVNTLVDEAFGSRSFAAPEMELGSDIESTSASDIYSLGKLLYWMASGGKMFPRENLNEAAMGRIEFSRPTDRGHIERWLRGTIAANPEERLSVQELLDVVDRDIELMRRHLNAVGSLLQRCEVCGIGQMKPRFVDQLLPLGLKAQSVNVRPEQALRFLLCSHCGYLRTHLILETTGQSLWEF
ncbi:MAG: protein kinase [Dehalococcoidia bacterium]